MNKKKILIILCLFCLSNSCSKKVSLTEEEITWLKENKNIKVSVFGNYPPYQFRNKHGDMDGVFIDYLNLIESKLGYEFTKVDYKTWSNVIEDAKNDKLDIILEIQKTEEFSKYLNFHAEIFDAEQMIVTRKKDFNDIDINNIAEKHLVLPQDFAITDKVRKDFPDIKMSFEVTEEDCLIALNSGKYDAYIGPKANSYYYIQNRNLKNLIIALEKTPYNYKPSIAVPKSKNILNKIIQKAVRSISLADREVIFNNWLLKKSFPIYHETTFWLFLLFLVIFFSLTVLFYNRKLKKLVIKKTEELQLALKTSEKNSEIKTNFIQNISHEIRTPTNGILGFSELLRKENISLLERSKYIDNIIDSGKDLVRIIDNVLEVSDLQTGQNVINNEVTNLNEIFNNIIERYRSNALKKKIKINYVSFENQDDFVIIDRLKLIKIVTKIVNNAVLFTFKGGVSLSYKKNNGNLEIKISDTGIGISKKDEDIIFDYFFQLKENKFSNNYNGLGLGLIIAKQNALILGGEISFVSKKNEGTTFYITLPFQELKVNNKTTTKALRKDTSNSFKVLVAEDEEINFLLVNSILSSFKPYNFDVIRAKNGKEAVSIYKNNLDFDLILMDIRMPILDGYEATRIIKQINPKSTIIAHTAYSTDKDILSAYEAGCDNVICKPVDIKKFKLTIQNYLKYDHLT